MVVKCKRVWSFSSFLSFILLVLYSRFSETIAANDLASGVSRFGDSDAGFNVQKHPRRKLDDIAGKSLFLLKNEIKIEAFVSFIHFLYSVF